MNAPTIRELLMKSWANTVTQADVEHIARVNPASMAGFLLSSNDGDVWRALAKCPEGGSYWMMVRNRLEGVRDEEALKTGT